MGQYGYYSSYFVFVLPALILAMYAQVKVSATFGKYSRMLNRRGLTGKDVAESVLRLYGIYDVSVVEIGGNLTDHYDPRANVIRLSQGVYNSTSVAALGVAAHETGHAIQHSKGYIPIKLRNLILPVANIGSTVAFPVAILGVILSIEPLIEVGIILFSAVVAFQIITLPVEFNASFRAMKVLDGQGILEGEELKGAGKVLRAAALTYVAAAAVSIGNLLRLLSLRGRDD